MHQQRNAEIMRYSTLLLLLLDRSQKMIKYTVLNSPGVKNHIIPSDSTFPYDQLIVGQTYAVKCSNGGEIWNWEAAYPINLTQVIKSL